MATDDDKKISIAVPGEWALKKVLGPTLDTLGEDINKVYQIGRDKIIKVAQRKVTNIEDGASANLRVSRDVFWNGAFTDEAICAEYFGGILASSRSQDGKDDSGVYYVDSMNHPAAELFPHSALLRIGGVSRSASREIWETNGFPCLSLAVPRCKASGYIRKNLF